MYTYLRTFNENDGIEHKKVVYLTLVFIEMLNSR